MTKLAGVLGLQGDFAAHMRAASAVGADVRLVRSPAELIGIDALFMPGGESTTMSLLLDSSGLRDPLAKAIRDGLPVLATCAGAILLARKLTGDHGSIPVKTLDILDATIDRNAYGRQVNSFETELSIDWPVLDRDDPDPVFHGVFIRAPRIGGYGDGVDCAAELSGEAVLVRQGNVFAATFHPELAGDTRLHQALLSLA